MGNPDTVSDERIKASFVAAPWVGGMYDGTRHYAFGPGNRDLDRVTTPVIGLFGTNDDVTTASFILPAMRQLGGPIYVVELVDQPHIFEQESWQDRVGQGRAARSHMLRETVLRSAPRAMRFILRRRRPFPSL